MSKSLRDVKPVDGPRLLAPMLDKSKIFDRGLDKVFLPISGSVVTPWEIFDRSLDPVFLTFSGPFAVTGEEIGDSAEVTKDLVERVSRAAGSRHHRAAMHLEDAATKPPDE